MSLKLYLKSIENHNEISYVVISSWYATTHSCRFMSEAENHLKSRSLKVKTHLALFSAFCVTFETTWTIIDVVYCLAFDMVLLLM